MDWSTLPVIDILGYMALAFALVSFAQSDMKKLRVLGIVASLLFFWQAMLLQTTSLIVANILFASLHFYHYRKLKKVVDNQ